MKKQNIFKLLAMSAVLFAVSAIISEKISSKVKTDRRTKDFAKYIFEDVGTIVEKYADEEEVEKYLEFVRKYNKSPKYFDDVIKRWAADSAKYAGGVNRDADIIHLLDKNAGKMVRFDDALKTIRHAKGPVPQMNKCWTGPGDKTWNMQINRRGLQDASLQLAIIRKAQQRGSLD